jgi:hypothetical protein
MKKILLVMAIISIIGTTTSFGAEFQGHKWGTTYFNTNEILLERLRHRIGTMTVPKIDSSPEANRDSFRGRLRLVYFDEIYSRRALVTFFFQGGDRTIGTGEYSYKSNPELSRVFIVWDGNLYDYICQCAQKEFGKPFKFSSERGIKTRFFDKSENGLANVTVGFDGRFTFMNYFSSYYKD